MIKIQIALLRKMESFNDAKKLLEPVAVETAAGVNGLVVSVPAVAGWVVSVEVCPPVVVVVVEVLVVPVAVVLVLVVVEAKTPCMV